MSSLFKTTFQCSKVEQESPVLHKIRFAVLVIQFTLTNKTGVAKGSAVSGGALALWCEVTAGGVITFQPRDRSDRTHRQLQTKTLAFISRCLRTPTQSCFQSQWLLRLSRKPLARAQWFSRRMQALTL